ncbi:hypothetical protein Clacol_010035 [Clathrus columnatus]|uniref:HRDC domain-containing protein n=1 Tax=Clathrus columnatus TaxID=1419009 RepID=A0AAV5APP6_9AGAM|nr:hypothetical protein Clacol_010035 [Clathrus columnatus]
MTSQGKKRIPSLNTHFLDYQATLQSSIDAVIKASSSLPDDISFHRSLDRQFGKRLDSSSDRILSLTSRLLDFIDVGNVNRQTNRNTNDPKGKRRLDSEEDVIDNFHSIVVDVLDQLLEQADIALDEYSGKIKPPAIPVKIQEEKPTKVPSFLSFQCVLLSSLQISQTFGKKLDSSLLHASHISKPQLLFRRSLDERNPDVPQRSQLKTKPNVIRSLEEYETDVPSSSSHPYKHEILNLQPPSHFLNPPPVPIPPEPLESSTPLKYIYQASQLPEVLQALSQATEIAIDLEHHSYRSFPGFVCLMQISTRNQDWIIDCLDPDIREELESFNQVFTNPNIVKVFHGADSDIVWLQQDFNLYIVNMFDTYHATNVLDFPKHSLAALLEMYCDFTADKRYQLADWRIRPLPTEMLDYARSDTHFLLYIYDNLRNALIAPRTPPPNQLPFEAGSPILEVIRRSSETALKVYIKEVYDAEGGTGPGGWEVLSRKWNKSIGSGDDVHSEVFRAVHAWRDGVARKEDESTRYVLPNHYLFRVAARPPSDLPALLAIFHPVPTLVRARSLELLDVIKDAVQRSNLRRTSTITENPVVVDGEDSNQQLRIIGSPEDVTSGIWDKLKTISNIAPSSALFGPSTEVLANYSAQSSSFLGSPTLPNKNEKYVEAVDRIHKTLTLGVPLPKQSKVLIPVVTTTTITSTTSTVVPALTTEEAPAPDPAAVAEIPFVPASQRPTIIQDPITNDNIVVVGRQNKRKRKDKNKETTEEGDNKETDGSPAPFKKQKSQEVERKAIEPHDFSKEKNILDESARDAVPTSIPNKKKRKDNKKDASKGGEKTGTSFGPAPRNRSEIKSGNMSGTFR